MIFYRATFVLVTAFTIFAFQAKVHTQPINKLVGDVNMPSANSTSMNKYNDIPVDPSTGVPNIAIPIHTVKHGGLSLPISLSYHASGIKVAEIASWVGLGWNLSSGGMITRSVLGIPDEGPEGYYNIGDQVNDLIDGTDAGFFSEISLGVKDGEPDIYSFSFPGYSGKFTFDHNKNIVLMPQQDLKVVPDPLFQSFTIIAPNGVRHIFSEKEHTLPGSSQTFVSSWHLTEISTPDDNYTINLSYKNITYENISPASYYKTYHITKPTGCTGSPTSEGYTGNAGEVNSTIIQGKLIQSITTPTEAITFYSSTNREDIPNNAAVALDSISIVSGSIVCKKTIFAYDYFVDNSSVSNPNYASCYKRLQLQSLQETSCDKSNLVPPYEFTYNGNIINGKIFLPNRLSKSIDHWGYYNAANNSNALLNIPPTTFSYYGSTVSEGNSNRSSDGMAMKLGTLRKISYPTGGETDIILEANKVNSLVTNERNFVSFSNCGSPMVSSCCQGTTTSDQDTVNMTSRRINSGKFKLHLADLSPFFGQQSCIPGNIIPMSITLKAYLNSTSGIEVGSYTFNHTHNKSDPSSPSEKFSEEKNLSDHFNFTAGSDYIFTIDVTNGKGSVSITEDYTEAISEEVGGLRIHQLITSDFHQPDSTILKEYEYTEANSQQSSGVLIFMPKYVFEVFQSPHSMISLSSRSITPLSSAEGYHIRYRRVTESIIGNGHKEYVYDITGTFQGTNPVRWPILSPKFNVACITGPVQENLYSADGTLIMTKSNVYGNIQEDNISKAWRVSKQSCSSNSGQPPVWGHANSYFINTGRVLLSTTIEVLDGVGQTTDFGYDPTNRFGFPISSETTGSDGKQHKQEYKYPIDYPDAEIRDTLEKKNIISQPYKTIIWVDNIEVDGSETEYGWYNLNTGQYQISSNSSFPRLRKVYRFKKSWDSNNVIYGPGKDLETTVNAYDAFGNISETQRVEWSIEKFTWDGVNGLLTEREFLNHKKEYNYHPNTRLVSSFIDVDGQEISYTYDQLMRLSKTTSRDGAVTTNLTYSFFNQDAQRPQNYIKSATTFTLVQGSNLTNLNTYQYFDGIGREIATVNQAYSSNNKDVITTKTYDTKGRLKIVSDPYETTFQDGRYIDLSGLGDFTVTEYYEDPMNRVKSTTPPDWHPTTFEYKRNTSTVTTPEGDVYFANSLRQEAISDPNGNKTKLFKDLLGREILTVRADDNGTELVRTQFVYDLKNRITAVYPPGSSVNTPELIYTYEYDAEDKVTEKKLPGQEKSEYFYDTRDLLTYAKNSSIPSNFAYIATVYDAYGRVIQTGFTTNKTSDNSNDISTVSSANILSESFFGSTGITIDKIDSSSVRVLDQDQLGILLTNKNFYDTHGRLDSTRASHIENPNFRAQVSNFTYDFADNIIKEVYTHRLNGETLSTVDETNIDHSGRLVDQWHTLIINSLSGPQVHVSSTAYTAKDQIATQFLGLKNGSFLQEVNFSYLANGFLDEINNPSNLGNDLFGLSIGYDQPALNSNGTAQYNGNIASLISTTASANHYVYGYNYDNLDRLTSADFYDYNDLSADNRYNSSYTYDALGNIQTLNRSGVQPSNQPMIYGIIDNLSYTYDNTNSNRLLSIIDNAPANTGSAGYSSKSTSNFTYDASGNMTYSPASDCNIYYNHLNLPYEFELSGKSIRYTYTADGAKLQELQISDGGDTLLKRGYFGPAVYTSDYLQFVSHPRGRIVPGECDLVISHSGEFSGQETYKAGTIQSNATMKDISDITYLAGEGISLNAGFNVELGATFVAEPTPCPATDKWIYQYSLADHLGNSRVLFADLNEDDSVSSDEIIQENHYYAFGLEMQGEWQNMALEPEHRYRYNGIERVEELGLDLAAFRSYDPAIGRWTSIDPKPTFSQSPYSGMGNNPVLYSDPMGDTIRIHGSNGVYNWIPGSTYDGDDSFISNAVSALNALTADGSTANFNFVGRRSSGVNFSGNAVLDYAEGGSQESKNVDIHHASQNPQFPGKNQHITGDVYWDPSKGIMEEGVQGGEGGGAFPSMGVLLHEMGHAALFNEFGGADWQDRENIFVNEEQMIIDRLETPAMNSLGFGNRSEHFNLMDSRQQAIDNRPGAIRMGTPFKIIYYINSPTPTTIKK